MTALLVLAFLAVCLVVALPNLVGYLRCRRTPPCNLCGAPACWVHEWPASSDPTWTIRSYACEPHKAYLEGVVFQRLNETDEWVPAPGPHPNRTTTDGVLRRLSR